LRQNGAHRIRRERIHVIVIPDDKLPALALDPQFSRFQDAAILIAENGHQNGVPQFRFRRVPLHVEEIREITRGAVFEYVPPLRIGPCPDRHVIGDDVEHLPQSRTTEFQREALVSFRSSEFIVHMVMINDVISVSAARRRLKVRR
jgi:hypothetical protein